MQLQLSLSAFIRIIFALLLSAIALMAQGPLMPPAGTPAPSMKSLAEVEARTNLQATPAPAGVDTSDANFQFVINQPGSYYLSANLGVTKADGIKINAEGVTLDLNGFQISRASGTNGYGINISSAAHRTSIRNGSIKGFGTGIQSESGANPARACSFRDLTVSNCQNGGIVAGSGTVLESCRAHDNSGFAAISFAAGSSLSNCTVFNNTVIYGFNGAGATLTNCVAANNTGSYGISVGQGSALTNCVARGNVGTGPNSAGIIAGEGSTITHCTAYQNTSSAPSTPTTGIGFDVGAGSTVQGCTATLYEGDGIRLGVENLARGNTCEGNGYNGDGAGIHVLNADNRIEDNIVTNNDRGIDVDVLGNLIVKNSAAGNASNYEIVANNKVGAIVAAPDSLAISGSTGGAGVGSTSPWANFSF